MAHPHDSYLESQVLTSTPQKLRLMLIDSAIASARQTLAQWEAGQDAAACETLHHCQNLVAELLHGVKPDETELTRKTAGIYVFLFKALSEAELHGDSARMADVLEVLELERETWRQVCEMMPEAPLAPQQEEMTAPPLTGLEDSTAPQPGGLHSGGFVLDA